MPEVKTFLHALRCVDAAAGAAARSSQRREWANKAACRAVEIRVLTDERLAACREDPTPRGLPRKVGPCFSLI